MSKTVKELMFFSRKSGRRKIKQSVWNVVPLALMSGQIKENDAIESQDCPKRQLSKLGDIRIKNWSSQPVLPI